MGIQLIRHARLVEIDEWLNNIRYFAKKDADRKVLERTLADKGYDIRFTAEWRNKFYINLLNPLEERRDGGVRIS